MIIELSGKTAIVTGATGGIGFAIAKGLANAGATVVICGREQARKRPLKALTTLDLAQIAEALQRDAASVVFLNVLAQQAGLPVPAVPTLLLAGSLAPSSGQLTAILGAAIVASVIADAVWSVHRHPLQLPRRRRRDPGRQPLARRRLPVGPPAARWLRRLAGRAAQ